MNNKINNNTTIKMFYPWASMYEAYLGVRYEVPGTDDENGEDSHCVIILHTPDDLVNGGNCVWYHARGGPFEEDNPYRKVDNSPRWFNNPFFDYKLPIGNMSNEKFYEFVNAFKSTPEQESHWFCSRVLRKLADTFVLLEHRVVEAEMEIERIWGPCPVGGEWEPNWVRPDTPSTGNRTPLIFQFEYD
ncbi:hypothetical protein BDW59DRAFT_165030 [Aspergillus cavernicola]|uniref:Uncharacterized protein n=1 Tax=Aspergillus cavernicola TaxID=176166 RepID=A0ABR4HVP9_9EURO